VPSGSRIRLRYEEEAVILPVRLQEMFGQLETPTICQGRIQVTIHLLSPAQRPLQVTSDLRSFWRDVYPLVKKEMAGRYPKHYWPDDPFTAIATAGTKKAMQKPGRN
jgi:ATP-dependent helicase HrpB